MKLTDLCVCLDQLLQPNAYRDYCKNGLQVEGQADIPKIATAVSASLATIEAAIDCGAKALIVHHGLFWDRDPMEITGTKKKKLQLLLTEEISLIAYHLPLDAHQIYGNNWGAANLLGLTNLEPFGCYNGQYIGVKGRISPQSRDTFAKTLENFYDHPAHSAFGGKEIIESVAIISGGAHKSILEASAQNIDCFITGSFDEPIWHQAFEEKINFYALGHSNTEKIGVQLLGKHLASHFNLACPFLDVQNPF